MRFLVPSTAKSSIPVQLIWMMRLLATIALGCGAFLSWRSLHAGPVPGCGGGSAWDCDHVLTSSWSRWLEIPVSYLGTLIYAGILLTLMLMRPVVSARWQKTAWGLFSALAVMAAISAIWFTGIQVFAIGKLCPYCLIIHSCGLLIFVLAVMGTKRYGSLDTSPDGPEPGNRMGLAVAGGVLGGAVLILGQIFVPHDTFVVEQFESDGDTAVATDDAEPSQLGAPGADENADADITFAAPGEFDAPREIPVPSDVPVPGGIGVTRESVAAGKDDSRHEPTIELPDEFADDLREPTAVAMKPNSVHTALKPITAKRQLSLFPSADPINVYEFPVLGDVEAPNLIVELVDYTCPQCREMYHHIEAARQHYGDQMAVVVRLIALERSCNPYVSRDHPKHKNACKYVRLALAIWHSDPTKFAEFHHWLMGPEKIPDIQEASAFAVELIGAEELKSSVRSAATMGMLGDNHRLWKRIDRKLPILFAGGRLMHGMPRSDEDFIERLSERLALNAASTSQH